jgi:hypothetical protein
VRDDTAIVLQVTRDEVKEQKPAAALMVIDSEFASLEKARPLNLGSVSP